MTTSAPTVADLRSAIELACQPTFVPRILEGRQRILSLPRDWVLEHLESTARAALDFTCPEYGDWEFTRLLELLTELKANTLLHRFIQQGLQSPNLHTREAAQSGQSGRPVSAITQEILNSETQTNQCRH